jgi:hypothetical protein
MPSRRRLAVLGFILALAGCGGSGSASTSGPVTSTSRAPSPTLPLAGSFEDLPFTLELPAGWVFGTRQDVEAALRSLLETDSADADRYQALLDQSPPFSSAFVAYNVASSEDFTPAVSCNTVDRGDTPVADALNLGQTQNLEGIGQLPGLIGEPTADRMTLPVGETVRIRWRSTGLGADTTSIGYLFVAGPTVFTCVFTAATDTVDTHQPEWESILGTFRATATTAASGAPSSQGAADCPAPGTFGHQAPEIEGLLPGIVQGRALTRWSVRGECWLELTIGDASVREQVVAAATTAANPDPVDPDQLVYGVAGRSVNATDPPYFVFAAVRPDQDDEVELALLLLFGGAMYNDIAAGLDLANYDEQTIGGKQVHVGTQTMVVQSEHQRGRPYLYQTDTHLFLVITDDEAWAADAIAQLP